MRLSTAPDRDEARAIEVLHAAFDAGVTFLDTADAYALDDREIGHNERLIAQAIASWTGDRPRIVVATKGGMTRPDGRWVPDGRARHLAAACEASLRALGVDRLALYQLHAPDPRTPLATSVRALAALQRDGLLERIGLCNVTVQQLREARRIAEIASVQVELNPWNDDHILSGVAAFCLAEGITLVAHRPLGGAAHARRALKEPALVDTAAAHGATPHEIALAWLLDLSPGIVPIPGATRADSARSIGRAAAIRLTDADRARLDARFVTAAALRAGRTAAPHTSTEPRRGDVVLIMGLPGAGKSTLAQSLVGDGYARVNRDRAGGSLRYLVGELERLDAAGHSRIVLDNTYVSRKSRAAVVQAASRLNLAVRCVWLTTSIEDAQVNAANRMWSSYGRLLTPDEMRDATKRDVSAFGPGVQFRYQRDLEPPTDEEGFARIDEVRFERTRDTHAVVESGCSRTVHTTRALLVTVEGVLARSREADRRTPTSPDDIEMIDACVNSLRRYAADGWTLLGTSWQPGIAEGTTTIAQVEATFATIRERLGVDIDVRWCPHGGGPPICWCRKPLPGLGVAFVRSYRLDPTACVYVGSGAHDAAFARRLGFAYRDAAAFCYPLNVPPN